jgi:hypothetical protein
MLCVLQDTVAIVWLNNTAQTQQAVQALQAKADSLGIQELLYGDRLVSLTTHTTAHVMHMRTITQALASAGDWLCILRLVSIPASIDWP